VGAVWGIARSLSGLSPGVFTSKCFLSLTLEVDIMATLNTSVKVPYKTGYQRGGSNTISTSFAPANTQSGSSNLNWRDKIARGEDASSNYQRLVTEFSQKYIESATVYNSTGVVSTAKTYVPPSNGFISSIPSTSETLACDDKALKHLKGRLANDTKQFKALVPLGELKETRGLIKSTAKAATGLLTGLVALKHGNVKDAAKRAADAWLQYSFAISPTISEVNSLVDSISSYMAKESWSARYTGKGSVVWHDRSGTPSSLSTGAYGSGIRLDVEQWHHSYSVQYTAGVIYDTSSANSYSLPKSFGLTFGDIIPAAWELVPWSWVVDYFTTMGDYLDDTFVGSAGDTVYCTKSVKYIRESNKNVRSELTDSRYSLLSQEQMDVKTKILIFQRGSLGTIPHRSLRIKTLDEIGVNSVKRLLNLASVLVK